MAASRLFRAYDTPIFAQLSGCAAPQAQLKSLLKVKRRETDVFLEQLGECALAAEAQRACDFTDLYRIALQRLASRLHADLHHEALRTRSESLKEFAMQLPGRKVHGVGE